MLNQFTDPAEFLRRAGDFLERHEAENNLLLEISSWLASHPDRIDQTPYFVTVEENGRIQAAAMMTPPHNLVLTESEPETIAAIVEHAFANGLVLPGVNGPSKTSKTFALLWSKRTGHAFHLHRSLRIYELTRVKLARPVNGKLRLASESDLEILVHWTRAFGVDIREQQSEEGLAKLVRGVIADQRLYVWEDGGLRSMAAWSAPTPNGVRINFVYTPPEFRGRGYAGTCVAALSQGLLDSGRKFCCLFTDLSNLISNRIYQRIGYRPVTDFTEYHFT